MTSMRRLNANDYDELLFVLNRAFGNIYKREMDFISELPRMWVRDDEYMGKHIGMPLHYYLTTADAMIASLLV